MSIGREVEKIEWTQERKRKGKVEPEIVVPGVQVPDKLANVAGQCAHCKRERKLFPVYVYRTRVEHICQKCFGLLSGLSSQIMVVEKVNGQQGKGK